MTERARISRKLIGVCHLLELGDLDDSYYMHHNRLLRAQEVLSEISEMSSETDNIKTKEVRKIERLECYLGQILEGEGDKDMSDLENVTEVISSGLAKKISEPEDFEGYRSDKKEYAEEIGLDIRIRGSA